MLMNHFNLFLQVQMCVKLNKSRPTGRYKMGITWKISQANVALNGEDLQIRMAGKVTQVL